MTRGVATILAIVGLLNDPGTIHATSVPLELLNRFLTVDSVVVVIGGQLDVSKDAVTTLGKQLRRLKTVSFKPLDYHINDYAITVGALVGTGTGIPTELSRIIGIGTARRKELLSLADVDAEIAQTEIAYAVSHRAAKEYERIFGELLDRGAGGIDRLLGSPVFDNWLTLYDEILPLLAERLSETRRIRKELDARRAQLRTHNNEAVAWLESLKKHLDRVREVAAAEVTLRGGQKEQELLSGIEDGRRKVAALQSELVATNQKVREEAKRIFERQKAAYKTGQWIKGITTVFQIGLSVAAGDAGSGGASMSAPGDGNISVQIENHTTIINLPSPELVPPTPPVILRP